MSGGGMLPGVDPARKPCEGRGLGKTAFLILFPSIFD